MPTTSWLVDPIPAVDPALWRLTVVDGAGRYQLGLDELAAFGVRMRATLDCTSGWYARQDWSGVPVSALLRGTGQARSLLVHSVTGLLPLCRSAVSTWQNVENRGTAASALALKSVRMLVNTMATTLAPLAQMPPHLLAKASNGHLIGGKLPASGRGPLVTLKPGATAHFSLIIHEACAVCAHPVDGNVVIYLPGQRQAQNGWLSARACPGLRGGGVLSPGTIRPGTGVPLYNV
jgi:hypothetical protein